MACWWRVGALSRAVSLVRQLVMNVECSWYGKRFACTCVVLFMLGVRIGHVIPASNQPRHAMHMVRRKHVEVYMRNGVLWRAKVVLPSTKTSRVPPCDNVAGGQH